MNKPAELKSESLSSSILLLYQTSSAHPFVQVFVLESRASNREHFRAATALVREVFEKRNHHHQVSYAIRSVLSHCVFLVHCVFLTRITYCVL